MKKISILVLLMVAHYSKGHNIKMALYEIMASSTGCSLDVSFDRVDLENAISFSFPELRKTGDLDEKNECLNDYLARNFQMEINGNCVIPEITCIIYEEEIIKIHAILLFQAEKVVNIEIFNSCLLYENRDYNNMVKLRLSDKPRFFHMSADRTKIAADYLD